MPVRAIVRMREAIRRRRYVMTTHAEEEMDADGLTIFDVESVILTGEVIERQRDRKTREVKYLVRGESLDGLQKAVVVSKFGPTDLLVILTVYLD
ncbi:MAG: DUF4258 domain-containing protein [Thermoanaerobaculia bacterium]